MVVSFDYLEGNFKFILEFVFNLGLFYVNFVSNLVGFRFVSNVFPKCSFAFSFVELFFFVLFCNRSKFDYLFSGRSL